ncbi:hypothetical protein HYPSUDRAFT_77798 [Hypholoma sublateritium FD-334 SS-4]|uniref:Uncharacterized protein n=1 Tax=Hypholoma sublateritium (strain FD-334 SS-4) TaxID=945553 RepID=A0A0D2PNX7_HYPSF|nr:hypothetical protein HYPSUDRAFT_77798 [Hypholoma sublateritium FD-334 SS-4]
MTPRGSPVWTLHQLAARRRSRSIQQALNAGAGDGRHGRAHATAAPPVLPAADMCAQRAARPSRRFVDDSAPWSTPHRICVSIEPPAGAVPVNFAASRRREAACASIAAPAATISPRSCPPSPIDATTASTQALKHSWTVDDAKSLYTKKSNPHLIVHTIDQVRCVRAAMNLPYAAEKNGQTVFSVDYISPDS